MNILVTSIVDLKRVKYNRIHIFLNHLARKHQITVLCLNAWWLENHSNSETNRQFGQDPYFQRVFDKVKIIYLTPRRIPPVLQEMYSFGSVYTFLRNTDSEGFDIHINYSSLVSGLFVTKILQSRGTPTVFDVADDLPAGFKASPRVPDYLRWLAGFISNKLFTMNVGHATKITFITESLRSAYALPGNKSMLLPNGVDLELFEEYSVEELERKMDIHPDDFVLGYVGILEESWVDFSPVFSAIRALAPTIPGIRMLIVGNGRGFIRLKHMAVEYGIEDYVRFTGYVAHERVPKYISCMDICVIPFSSSEMADNASPIKLFEYMACGRPVISTPLAGVFEAAEGRVLYAHGEEEWRQRILQLYNSPVLCTSMGIEGKAFVRSNYNWTQKCQQFEEVLMDVVARSVRLSSEGI